MLSYALLVTALFVRHFHPSEEFTIARRMFSLSLLIMYLRFLEAFLMSRRLGPTLIMIKEMVRYTFEKKFHNLIQVFIYLWLKTFIYKVIIFYWTLILEENKFLNLTKMDMINSLSSVRSNEKIVLSVLH